MIEQGQQASEFTGVISAYARGAGATDNNNNSATTINQIGVIFMGAA